MTKGFKFYANIMAATMDGPKTRAEIQETVGCKQNTLDGLLVDMVGAGLLHVSSVTGRCHKKRWGFDGVRTEPVLRSTLLSFSIAWETMSKPSTVRQIVETTGLNQARACEIVKHCREVGIIRIDGYLRNGKNAAAQYLAGPGKSAKRPAPKSKARASMEHRRRERWGAQWATMVSSLDKQ